MQAAGGLKKKRKRNIGKVTGLAANGYDPNLDNFDIFRMHSQDEDDINRLDFSTQKSLDHTNISISRLNSSNRRPTRDARFARDNEWDEGGSIFGKYSPPQSAHSKKSLGLGEGICPRALLSDNVVIARLKHILRLGIMSCSFPWTWNSKTYQIDKWPLRYERIWKVVWVLFAIQSFGITLYQIYSFATRMHKDEDGSHRPIFMNSFSVLWYSYAVMLNWCMMYHRDQIRCLINTMLEMNMKYVEKYLITVDGHEERGKIFLNVSVRTNTGQVFISTCLFLVMPFQPWYLYSFIYEKDQPWYFLIPGAMQEFAVIGQILAVYLLIGWVVVAHCNSTMFWLQETHKGNDTGCTTEELRRPEIAIELYRSMQVLTALFNSVMSSYAIPISKIINWSALIPCGYVLMRSMNQKFVDEFPGILTYPFGVTDCITCAYGVLQISAEMQDIAASFLTSWSMTRQKNLRRILLSCRTMRVKIGEYYFITVSTTITYFKSCFDYIIDCIITFK